MAVVLLEALGQAEVGDLGDPVAGEQDVRGLEVAVDDPRLVCGVDRSGEDAEGLGRPEPRLRRAGHPHFETPPFEQL